MKNTNKIVVIDMFNDRVTIKPIPYNVAIEIIDIIIKKLSLNLRYPKGILIELAIKDKSTSNDVILKRYENLYNLLNKKENTLRKKYDYIDKQYVIIGVNGNNHNFVVHAELYNELDSFLSYMEEIDG